MNEQWKWWCLDCVCDMMYLQENRYVFDLSETYVMISRRENLQENRISAAKCNKRSHPIVSYTSSPLMTKAYIRMQNCIIQLLSKPCEGQQSCYYLVQEYQNTVKGVSRQMQQGQQCMMLHSFCGYPHHVSVRKIWTVS